MKLLEEFYKHFTFSKNCQYLIIFTNYFTYSWNFLYLCAYFFLNKCLHIVISFTVSLAKEYKSIMNVNMVLKFVILDWSFTFKLMKCLFFRIRLWWSWKCLLSMFLHHNENGDISRDERKTSKTHSYISFQLLNNVKFNTLLEFQLVSGRIITKNKQL